jgi:hypothetical protein
MNQRQKTDLLGRLLETSVRGLQMAQLSHAQQRSWFMESLAPGGAQNIAAAVRAQGPLDLCLLESCVNEVIRRHEVLRTNFTSLNGKPVQLITDSRKISITDMSCKDAPEDLREKAAFDAAVREAYLPFDLSSGPLLRLTSLKMGPDDRILLLVMHHIIADEWSIGLLLEELGVLYAQNGNPSGLPDLPVQYADFAEWQAETLTPSVLQYQLDYWKKKLEGASLVLEIPTDRPRPAIQTTNGAMEVMPLARSTYNALVPIMHSEQATLFMGLFAAFNVLVQAWTGREDILIGTDFANRNRHETSRLIGFFVNEIVLRTDLSGNPTFRELLRRVRRTSLECYDHQDLPFQWLVEELKPARDRSRTPLFQIVFDFHNVPMVLQFENVTFSPMRLPLRPAKYDLTLFISESSQDLYSLLEYNTDLYDLTTAQQLLRDYQEILRAVAENPEIRVADLADRASRRDACGLAASVAGQR